MSVKAITWAFEKQLDDPRAKLVLLALADHADDDGLCWPTISRISVKACCKRSSVFNKLTDIETAGLIARISDKDEQGRQKGNIYVLNLFDEEPQHLVSRVQALDSEPSPRNRESRVHLRGLEENRHRTVNKKDSPSGHKELFDLQEIEHKPQLQEKANGAAREKPKIAAVPDPPTRTAADLERELFERGKQLLGRDSGGLIAKLIKARGSVASARAAIEMASTKQNAREYIGACLRGIQERDSKPSVII